MTLFSNRQKSSQPVWTASPGFHQAKLWYLIRGMNFHINENMDEVECAAGCWLQFLRVCAPPIFSPLLFFLSHHSLLPLLLVLIITT